MRRYAGTALILFVTLAAAIGSYTINLKVSAERAAVEGLRRQLVADARDMRNLQAELRTRARLPEMQRWNDNVLLMAAPAAGQFLRSPVQLASYGAATEAPALRYAVTRPETAADAVAAPVIRTAYAPDGAAVARGAPAPGTPRANRAAPAQDAPRVIRAAYASPAAARPPAALDDLVIDSEVGTASTPARPGPPAPAADGRH